MIDFARLRRDLSPGSLGIVYVWGLMILAFSIYDPNLFLTMATVRVVLNSNVVSGIAALAVLLPMATGAINASVGGTISLTSVSCVYLLSNTTLPTLVVVGITIAIGAAIGLANAFVVVTLKIPSIIGTLAMWLICDALTLALAGNLSSLTAPQLNGELGRYLYLNSWQDLTVALLYLVMLAVIIGTLLTQTSTGRNAYAVGFNPDVSRNTGVRVNALQAGTLVLSGVLGAFAGMVLVAQTAGAAPGGGTSYLLPAFAAVFLGATQFRLKRFTAWGTLLAVYMLGTGTYGLQLAGAAEWVPNVFQGVALIAAIGISRLITTRTLGPSKRKASRILRTAPVPDLA